MSWIEETEWNRIQQSVPIVCVDVLPIEMNDEDEVSRIGLILRDTPHEGEKWCTIGGRLLYGESIGKGLFRQTYDALGDDIYIEQTNPNGQPLYVAQYSPSTVTWVDFDAIDPRKHAIGLTYCVKLTGNVKPQNEAIDFRWFSVKELPFSEMGFNQDKVISECVKRLKSDGHH